MMEGQGALHTVEYTLFRSLRLEFCELTKRRTLRYDTNWCDKRSISMNGRFLILISSLRPGVIVSVSAFCYLCG